MTLQESILKLTFDPSGGSPKVLLTYGDMLADGPLHFPQVNGADVTPTPDSSYPLILDKLNSEFSMRFTVVDDSKTSLAEAMRAVLDNLITTAALGVKPLKIEVSGITGHYWLVAQCKITAHDPWNEPSASEFRVVKSYTLTCAGISYV